MKWITVFFWIVIFIFVILFSLQNKDEVTLRFVLYPFKNYHWEVSGVPLFLTILCSILFGVLIGGVSDVYKRFMLKKSLRKSQKTIERLEKEIESLRSSD